MQCLWNFLAVVAACLLVALIAPGACDPSISGGGDNNVIGRPSRPQVFSSPEELRTYLEQLSNYFAIAGRPRFGKRYAPTLQYRPTLKKMLATNAVSLHNNDAVVVDDATDADAADAAPLRYNRYPPASNSDLYQMLYPYDE